LLTTDVVGGVWDFCITLAGGLRAAGDEVVLLALGSPELAHRQAAHAVDAQIITVPLKLEWMADADDDVFLTSAVVSQIARQVGADVVHANQFAAACADVDVPLVLTLHSDVLSWRRWTLSDVNIPREWHQYAALVREALLRADSVVAVSQFLANEVAELYGVQRDIDVVHNGWTAPATISTNRGRATLVAGRIWDAAKNVALVAEAARGWDPGPVYLAGESQHPDGGHAAVPDVFRPMGFLVRSELDALMDSARVYISAARYDPFGLLPLQAALHGCRLVLSDIPSYREVWGDCATYFDSGNARDLRRQWQVALEMSPDDAAQRYAREQLSVQAMVEQYRMRYAAARQVVAA
jgi:glycosyltransferase involved in cell wall biosynthesis